MQTLLRPRSFLTEQKLRTVPLAQDSRASELFRTSWIPLFKSEVRRILSAITEKLKFVTEIHTQDRSSQALFLLRHCLSVYALLCILRSSPCHMDYLFLKASSTPWRRLQDEFAMRPSSPLPVQLRRCRWNTAVLAYDYLSMLSYPSTLLQPATQKILPTTCFQKTVLVGRVLQWHTWTPPFPVPIQSDWVVTFPGSKHDAVLVSTNQHRRAQFPFYWSVLAPPFDPTVT